MCKLPVIQKQFEMRRRVATKLQPSPVQLPTLTAEEEQELDYDICFCIEEIENVLSKNPTEKQKKLGEISLKILRNPGEPFIKKKQIMRQWCGDYRKKFENKKKQLSVSLNENKASFRETKTQFKSVCYRKHESKNSQFNSCDDRGIGNSVKEENTCSFKTSDNSFKFQF